MTSPPSLPPAIVAAIIVDGGRVLMVRRRIPDGSLSWQFPAGEMEPGETAFDTASRETDEEVGLRVRPTGIIGEREHPVTARRIIYVGCAVEEGSTASLIDTEELEELEWCTWSQAIAHVPAGLFDPVGDYLQATLIA